MPLGSPDPYSRFGSVRGTPLRIEEPLAEYLQALVLAGEIPAAAVTFAPACDEAREVSGAQSV